MKCPKCGYLGFDSPDRCKHCGYDFSLAPRGDEVASSSSSNRIGVRPVADDRAVVPPLPRARPERQAIGPDRPPPVDPLFERLPDGGPLDLPLFDPPGERPSARPTPPARPPLSVRRGTPSLPKGRPKPDRLRPVDLDFGVEGAPERLSADTDPEPPVPIREAASPGDLPAGGRRVFAATLDLAVVAAIDLVVLSFTLRMAALAWSEVRMVVRPPLIGFFLLLNLGYLVGFTGTVGQTLGKMATGLTVVRQDRLPMDLARGVLRECGCLLTLATCGLGFLPAVFGRRRALHDWLAGTDVRRLDS
jgi:uncharacterized RDD family membrane protein YckC